MDQTFTALRVTSPSEHVLLATLNRPESANSMITALGSEIIALFEALNLDAGETRCVVLTGAGERAFCAGADLKERRGMSDEAWTRQHLVYERMVRAMLGCPVPLIAAVNGAAYAGGCELALACDFIYAAENTRFALTEVTLGIMPGAGGTQTLARAVGERRAKEIILTARPFSAEQAHAWGLVNRLCEPGSVLREALETADAIAANAPLAARQAKKSIRYGGQMEIRTAYRFEVEAYNQLVDTDDRREGILAFNEKRKPLFRGR